MKARLEDGIELFYTVDDFTDPWTNPETVVLHHGMAKNHKLWYAWVPILARHYRVIRFDMRGMGQSQAYQSLWLLTHPLCRREDTRTWKIPSTDYWSNIFSPRLL